MTQSANERQVGGDHYRSGGLQHWDIMSQNGIGYLEGCLTKYLRHRKKKGLEDVQKMMHYLDKIIDCVHAFRYEATGRAPWSQIEDFCLGQGYNESETYIMTVICRWRTLEDLERVRPHIQALIDDYSTT